MLLKDLTTLTASLASGTLFHVEKSGKAYNIDYTKLAKAIVEEYNGSTLGGSAQTVQAAIGALNSRLFAYYSGTLDELRTPGVYYGDFSDSPHAASSTFGVCIVSLCPNTANVMQKFFAQGFSSGVVEYSRSSSSASAWRAWQKQPTRAEVDALSSNVNFGVNTSAASTEKAVYIKAIADAVAEAVGITTNKSILGYVFVSGIDAFSCMGAIRGSTIRMIVVASNAATYSVVRDGNGAVTYKEIAMVS